MKGLSTAPLNIALYVHFKILEEVASLRRRAMGISHSRSHSVSPTVVPKNCAGCLLSQLFVDISSYQGINNKSPELIILLAALASCKVRPNTGGNEVSRIIGRFVFADRNACDVSIGTEVDDTAVDTLAGLNEVGANHVIRSSGINLGR